jgi:hypothetical protein
MNVSNPITSCEYVLDTMIQLAFAERSHRIIAAGSAAFDLYCGLCRRGFCRTAVASHLRAPPDHQIASESIVGDSPICDSF